MESRKNGSVVSCCDKVFVGSIPGYYREKDVRAIFEPYGIVTSVRINFKAENPSLNRGYCILTFRDPALAAHLIDTKQIHIGNGRYVICKPYLQGQRLQREILKHDQRRLILKHLPDDLDEYYIKEYFEAMAGRVEVVFVYQPDHPNSDPLDFKRVRTASVTFHEVKSVDRLFSSPTETERMIGIDGRLVKIQRFRYQNRIQSEEGGRSQQEEVEGFQPRKTSLGTHFCIPSLSRDLNHGSGSLPHPLDHSSQNLRFNILVTRSRY